jgi:thiol:disulfide interchange protein
MLLSRISAQLQKFFFYFGCTLLFLLFGSPSAAQSPDASASAERPNTYTPETAPREINAAVQIRSWLEANQIRSDLNGKTTGHLEIVVQIETKNSFKLYEDKLIFWTTASEALGGEEWKVSILQKPNTSLFMDPISKSLKPGYKGESTFKLKLELPAAGLARPLSLNHKIKMNTGFQACSESVCLFPAAIQEEFEITNQAKVAVAQRSKGLTARSGEIFEKYLGSSGGISLVVVLLLIFAGVLTAFTPCVYPLYPITLGIFSRWGQRQHSSPFLLVISYCVGIILSYATIGLVSAASGAVFGSLTQTPAFLIAVGTLILASAFVFSGLIDFKIFTWLQNRFSQAGAVNDKQKPATLYAKAFGMGAVLGLVASPCVGPVLISLLAWLSTRLQSGSIESYVQGFLLFAAFGVGMSLPFLVLGHFVIKMGSRPTLGRYTPYIKYMGSLLMVVASLYFLIPGISLLRLQSTGITQTLRYPVKSLETWSKNKLTVLDFRADWCSACIELEHETFASSEISKRFESGEWEMVQIDLTETNEANRKIAEKFSVRGLPTVLISNEKGEICLNLSLFGFENSKDFEARLNRVNECETAKE